MSARSRLTILDAGPVRKTQVAFAITGWAMINTITVLSLFVIGSQQAGRGSDSEFSLQARLPTLVVEIPAAVFFFIFTTLELIVDLRGNFTSRREWGIVGIFLDVSFVNKGWSLRWFDY